MLGRGARVVALASAAVVALLVSTACSGGEEPDPTPSPTVTKSPSPSVSESSSPSPSASATIEIPEAARAHTPEGGIEFAKFAVLQGGHALHENNASLFMALTLPECRGCAGIRDAVESQRAEGRRHAEQRISIIGAQLFSPPTATTLEIDLLGTEAAVDVVDANGEVVDHLAEEVLRVRIGLIWVESGWKLGEIAVVDL